MRETKGFYKDQFSKLILLYSHPILTDFYVWYRELWEMRDYAGLKNEGCKSKMIYKIDPLVVEIFCLPNSFWPIFVFNTAIEN